ncbi:MAG: hypothetical protein ACTSPM_11730, partial [Candidatus Heimdallarchaeota archaeon]
MSNAKLNALQDLIDTPKDLYKLQVYEQKLHSASTTLLFDIRAIATNIQSSSKHLEDISRLMGQLRIRIDTLIDQSRRIEVRIRPGTSDKNRRTIFNNAILFDFILFSKCWDLKISFGNIDSLIVFEDKDKIKSIAKQILEDIQTTTELFSSKENVTMNIQSSEEVAETLLLSFNKELEFAERAGALKGILKLEKPRLVGKGKYYDQLGNIILKIIMTFDTSSSTEPIALRAILSRLIEEYPRVKANNKDLQKVLVTLDETGLLILKQDREGQFWVQLHPSETETNIILGLAKDKGHITLEEL